MDLLTDKLEDAEYLADLALNRALEINGTAMEIKSRNLLGIIQYSDFNLTYFLILNT